MHPKQMQCQNEHASSKTNNMLENTETFKNLSQLVIQVTRPSLCHTCTQTLRTPLSVTFIQTSKSRRANPPFLCPLCQFMCVCSMNETIVFWIVPDVFVACSKRPSNNTYKSRVKPKIKTIQSHNPKHLACRLSCTCILTFDR